MSIILCTLYYVFCTMQDEVGVMKQSEHTTYNFSHSMLHEIKRREITDGLRTRFTSMVRFGRPCGNVETDNSIGIFYELLS
jgi:hypothetical protein